RGRAVLALVVLRAERTGLAPTASRALLGVALEDSVPAALAAPSVAALATTPRPTPPAPAMAPPSAALPIALTGRPWAAAMMVLMAAGANAAARTGVRTGRKKRGP